jgi:cytochrome P450
VSRQPVLFSSPIANGGRRIFNENEVGLTNAGDSGIETPLISRDPPSHTQYRKFVMLAQSPVRIEGIEARVREKVKSLIDAIPLGEAVDLMQALTAPLPLMTLAELLGLPADMWEAITLPIAALSRCCSMKHLEDWSIWRSVWSRGLREGNASRPMDLRSAVFRLALNQTLEQSHVLGDVRLFLYAAQGDDAR